MQMNSILRVKRDGKELSKEQIEFWVRGITDQSIPDYQSSAMLMAIYLNGMNVTERSALTLAMAASGSRMNWDHKRGYIIDKHSSGGIGDKTSFMLAATMAACGLRVPMISGRGLGFTGGTLDKLHSLPGFTHELLNSRRREILESVGAFIGGQTADIAPADKTLYALRDVTETVDEISLITASILSKKFTEDLDGLVLDVKCGTGAFMQNPADAKKLAESLVSTSKAAGMDCTALITRMNFPLGRMVGNFNEMLEAFDYLQPGSAYQKIAEEKSIIKVGNYHHDAITGAEDSLVFVTMALSLAMLNLSGMTLDEAYAKILALWKSGELLKKFEEILSAQGVDLKKTEKARHDFDKKWEAQKIEVKAGTDGFLCDCQGAQLGNLMVELGAGRKKAEDEINPLVSFEITAWENKAVQKGETIAYFYAPELNEASAQEYAARFAEVFTIKDKEGTQLSMIIETY